MKHTDPIIDASSNFLEWKLPQGDLQNRIRRTAEGEVDLVTFKQSPDSWLGGVLLELRCSSP